MQMLAVQNRVLCVNGKISAKCSVRDQRNFLRDDLGKLDRGGGSI